MHQDVSVSNQRVVNHSYVGNYGNPAINFSAVARTDWLVATDDCIQVIGLPNGGAAQPILSTSMNAISVGRTDLGHGGGSASVAIPLQSPTVYANAHPRPDLVVPEPATSYATPVVKRGCHNVDRAAAQNPANSAWSLESYDSPRYPETFVRLNRAK